jgi:hypothetical protein
MPEVAAGRVSPRHAANVSVTHFLQHWQQKAAPARPAADATPAGMQERGRSA